MLGSGLALAVCLAAVCLAQAALVQPAFAQAASAQDPAIDAIKGKIFDARMAEQMFGNGLKHCGEIDGSNFYFAPRDRVLSLEEYHRSLQNLVQQHAFNPEKRRPWTDEDAALRWSQVQREAAREKDNCALVASLPELEKELAALQNKTGAPGK